MIDIITFPDNNGKPDKYTGGDIYGIYHYLEMIGDPATLTTSYQRSHYFNPSYSINNYTAYLQRVLRPSHQQITSNQGSLLPTPALWFHLSFWRLNYHAIDNGYVKVHISEFPVEFNYESFLDPDTTPIKSNDDDEMYHIQQIKLAA